MSQLGKGLILIFFFSAGLFGQDRSQWIQCSGEAAVLNMTYEDAQVLAKRRARLDAIEKVCGVSMQAESLVRDFMAAP